MELSATDLSHCLGVTPDTVSRWHKQGKLPVSRKGAGYVFIKKDMERWARKNNITLDFVRSGEEKKKETGMISLVQAVQAAGVHYDIQGRDVETVFASAVSRMAFIPDAHKQDLLSRLLEREAALSTGIGNGIAIPHPRVQADYISAPAVFVGYLAEPLDYRALDNRPVSILFFLLCPDLKVHLHLLSVLSFCLRNDRFVDFLKSRPDQDLMIEKIGLIEQTYTL